MFFPSFDALGKYVYVCNCKKQKLIIKIKTLVKILTRVFAKGEKLIRKLIVIIAHLNCKIPYNKINPVIDGYRVKTTTKTANRYNNMICNNYSMAREKMLTAKISRILNCYDEQLIEKIKLAIINFGQLDMTKKYHLAFSGGKDSHALLIVFLLWKEIFNVNTHNFTVMFSDTRLETEGLYQLVENIENSVKGINFERVFPEHSYWYYQFVIGYPVPDWKIRWCTVKLKVNPMNKTKTISVTGRHFGESLARDARLNNSCSSGECGIDKIKASHDPIVHFRNCDVWDLIFYADNTVLYEGVFNVLKTTYSQSENEKGSLRMGCFMCPVVGEGSIYKDPSRFKHGWDYRLLLEKLRNCRRINSPRKNKTGKRIKGSIYIGDRRKIWQELDKETLLKLGYITKQEIREIDLLIQKDSYPKTYSQEWINSEHKRLESETIYTGLPLFDLLHI